MRAELIILLTAMLKLFQKFNMSLIQLPLKSVRFHLLTRTNVEIELRNRPYKQLLGNTAILDFQYSHDYSL